MPRNLATVPASKYELCERLMMDELDTYTGVLTATQQRTLFGGVFCGKKIVTISCDGQGEIRVHQAAWEGTHTSYYDAVYSFDRVLAIVNSGARV